MTYNIHYKKKFILWGLFTGGCANCQEMFNFSRLWQLPQSILFFFAIMFNMPAVYTSKEKKLFKPFFSHFKIPLFSFSGQVQNHCGSLPNIHCCFKMWKLKPASSPPFGFVTTVTSFIIAITSSVTTIANLITTVIHTFYSPLSGKIIFAMSSLHTLLVESFSPFL